MAGLLGNQTVHVDFQGLFGHFFGGFFDLFQNGHLVFALAERVANGLNALVAGLIVGSR